MDGGISQFREYGGWGGGSPFLKEKYGQEKHSVCGGYGTSR